MRPADDVRQIFNRLALTHTMKTNPFPAHFVLRCGNLYVGNVPRGQIVNALVDDKAKAMRLDARDNENLKADFFTALIGAEVKPEAL